MQCDVCGSDDYAGVFGSGLGPISFCFCKTCLERNREPVMMFNVTLELVGPDVAAHVRQTRTMLNGVEMTWDEWVAALPEGAI
jgi:hypothetical protein